jgi:hypothetical protein
MILLLGQLDGLGRFIAHADVELASLRCDRQVAVAQSSDQVKGLLYGLLVRQPQRILADGLLDGRAHLGRGTKETVRGHQSRKRLMGSLKIVGVDEEPQPPLTVSKVGKHRPRQKLVPQGLPESLDLPQRLRMLRSALDVPDPLAPQFLLELRLAPPRRVLSPLVGQKLAWRPVRRDSARQRLHHQARLLVVRERRRNQVARVVVQKRGQIQSLVSSQ